MNVAAPQKWSKDEMNKMEGEKNSKKAVACNIKSLGS
jgi:hypothetical protein